MRGAWGRPLLALPWGWLFVTLAVVLAAKTAVGAVAWQLWRGDTLLGAVSVREQPEGALAALDDLGAAAGYGVALGDEAYVLERQGRRVEFVAQAPVARVDGRIYPLMAPVVQEDGRWWADARAVLVLLNNLEGRKGPRALRWSGKVEGNALSEDLPHPPARLISSEDVPEALPAGAPALEQSSGLTSAELPGPPVQVRRVRWGNDGGAVRVVFDLSGPPSVALDESTHTLKVALAGTLLRDAAGVASPFGGTVDLAVAQIGGRLECTFTHRASGVKSLVLQDPDRLVIDFLNAPLPGKSDLLPELSPATAAPLPVGDVGTALPAGDEGTSSGTTDVLIPSSVEESAETPLAVSATPEKVEERSPGSPGGHPPRQGPRLVVVDAGHGGKDPGAQGNKLREKDLNLKVALNLAKRLQDMGFRVRLTRGDDTYLKLKERTDIANTDDADLFISIHTNALPKGRHAKGVEIYIMALPSDKDAMELALFENRELAEDVSSSHAAADKRTQMLLKILGDMQQNVKVSDSMEFAETLFHAGKAQGLNMRRIAQAPFFVLRGAGMPSVLVEMGYITESSEAKTMATQAFQDRMAAALAAGAERYLRR